MDKLLKYPTSSARRMLWPGTADSLVAHDVLRHLRANVDPVLTRGLIKRMEDAPEQIGILMALAR